MVRPAAVHTDLSWKRSCSKTLFTIAAEVHARSLANFYGQYADRRMNLKFKRRVRQRERAIWQFVIVKNKLMSVCNAFVLLLTMNFVITLIHSPNASWIHSYFDNVVKKFFVNNGTDALKTDINLFFMITNCQIARSRKLTHHINYKFMCVSTYWQADSFLQSK